jgi:hypothetical protein
MWRPCSGKWVAATNIPGKEKVGHEKLANQFKSLTDANSTMGIWTDRRMRAYLGITAHWIEPHIFKMNKACIAVYRIFGRHTATNILENFDSVIIQHNLKGKMFCIVSDNASNMRKAFELSLLPPIPEEDEHLRANSLQDVFDSEEDEDDTDGWTNDEVQALENTFDEKMNAFFAMSEGYVRLGCVNHAFHNAVGDGLKEAGARIRNCLHKVKYFVTLLHKSSKFFDFAEKAFGKEIGLPASVPTRWTSMLREAESFLKLNGEAFESAIEMSGEKKAIQRKLTAQDKEILEEFINVLDLFLGATL